MTHVPVNGTAADVEFRAAWSVAAPYTSASPECALALWRAVHAILDNHIPGAFVECGVAKGGTAVLIALALLARAETGRELILFDAFDGTSRSLPKERNLNTNRAAPSMDAIWQLLARTGYDMRLVRIVPGDVALTLPRTQTLRIALMRLDTDSYDSTLAGLTELYPRLALGGILIAGEYERQRAVKRAVDEFFTGSEGYRRPMFWNIDANSRGSVKIDLRENVEIERYDYVPAGMSLPNLLPFFPHALPQNPWDVPWPYLRKHIPHIWRSDSRNTGPVTGYASVEEAACLHELARLFSGKRGLEIGTHFGWTAAHLLAAGLKLDCIDPAFSDDSHASDVRKVLDAVRANHPQAGDYHLWAGYSPELVPDVRAHGDGAAWSFAFIDGNHDGDAPVADANCVIQNLSEDALVVFHDMTSPYVGRGLAVFHEAGFNIRLFNTAQILGIAWRGEVSVPEHVADPNCSTIFLPHLAQYVDSVTVIRRFT